jgi:hypothetical protein
MAAADYMPVAIRLYLFPMKIALTKMILGLFALSFMCDKRRRPRRGAPAADQ